MKCWPRVLTAASTSAACAKAFAQQSEHARAVASAKRVLSTEEFDNTQDSSYIEGLLQSFVEWLNGLFGETENPLAGLGSVLAPIFIAVIIGLLIVLAAWIVSLIAGRTKEVVGRDLLDERRAPPHELLRLSDEAFAKGDYSRAFTLAYWALLKLADAAGHLDYSDDATNWEILATLKSSVPQSIVAEARKLARLFDEIDYGDSRAQASDVAAVRQLISQLESVEVAA